MVEPVLAILSTGKALLKEMQDEGMYKFSSGIKIQFKLRSGLLSHCLEE